MKGRKRHALVDTDGRPLLVEPHTADVQDRDGGSAVLQISRGLFPFIEKVWADGGYNHERVTQATSITVEIVSKIAGQSRFVVLPRRWVVERFFAWINCGTARLASQSPVCARLTLRSHVGGFYRLRRSWTAMIRSPNGAAPSVRWP